MSFYVIQVEKDKGLVLVSGDQVRCDQGNLLIAQV